MAEQQAFHPGVSLAGAVDLEALKHQVKAEPGQAGGAPAAGGYVIDTTENTFQAMVQTSATFPILLFLWVPTDDRLFAMARALGDAVNKLNGQIQLSRIDIASNPSIAQAFQIQGAPALFALIGGRPMPILQGLPSDEELQQITDVVVPKLIAAAQQAAPSPEDVNLMSMGYAAAYPLGVLGIILSILITKAIFRVKIEDEIEEINRETEEGQVKPHLASYEVVNTLVDGKTLLQLHDIIHCDFVVSRLMDKGGNIIIPKSSTQIHVGDKLYVVMSAQDEPSFQAVLGHPIEMGDEEWEAVAPDNVVSRRIPIRCTERR